MRIKILLSVLASTLFLTACATKLPGPAKTEGALLAIDISWADRSGRQQDFYYILHMEGEYGKKDITIRPRSNQNYLLVKSLPAGEHKLVDWSVRSYATNRGALLPSGKKPIRQAFTLIEGEVSMLSQSLYIIRQKDKNGIWQTYPGFVPVTEEQASNVKGKVSTAKNATEWQLAEPWVIGTQYEVLKKKKGVFERVLDAINNEDDEDEDKEQGE